MSNWESPEQRQIRQLREQVRYLNNTANQNTNQRRKLEEQLSQTKIQMNAERVRMQKNLEKQEQNLREQKIKNEQNNARIQALGREMLEKERLQNDKMRQMEKTHSAKISELKQEFRIENGKLKEAITSTREEMRTGLSNLERQVNQNLKLQKQEINERIDFEVAKVNQNIKVVDAKVNNLIESLRREKDGEKQLAKYWVEQAIRLRNQLVDSYRPQLIPHKILDRLDIDIDLARKDLENGRFASAADGGRSAFYNIMDLREDVMEAELEWNFWFNAIKEREIQMLEMVQEGEARSYEIELYDTLIESGEGLDYWTKGQFSIAKKNVENLRVSKLNTLENKTTEELKQILDEIIIRQEEMIQIENTAHTNFTMSVERFRMANEIGEILGKRYNMTLSDGNFFKEENNDEYHAIFENPITKDKTVVVIKPEPGPDGIVSNHLEVIIDPYNNNPDTREKINEAVVDDLQRQGMLDDKGLPCYEKYGERTAEKVTSVGDIVAVEEGRETARL